VVPPEICRAVSRENKLCNVASFWTYIRITIANSLTGAFGILNLVKYCYKNSLFELFYFPYDEVKFSLNFKEDVHKNT
jgi:hypothetical protein